MAISTNRLAPTLLTIALALGSATCSRTRSPSAVVLIVVDTLRADHISSYGYPLPTTPALDRWSESAAVFDRAYSTSSWTLPAIGSILTGLMPSTHGAQAVKLGGADDLFESRRLDRRDRTFSSMQSTIPTLGSELAQRGFTTGAIVNNPFLKPDFGLDRGFDSYDFQPRRDAEQVVDLALDWLASRSKERFFLFLHFIDPHLPYDPPATQRHRFSDGIDSQLTYPITKVHQLRRHSSELSAGDRQFLEAVYDEEIAALDLQLERLFEGMSELDLWQRALVVFTSDHGEEFFEHGGFEHGHSMFEEVVRVPLILWSTKIPPRRYSDPVSVVDIAPTVLDALDLGEGPLFNRRTLWPRLTAGDPPPGRLIAIENNLHGPDQKALIRWPNKLILGEQSRTLQLFDLDTDPEEARDLSTSPNADLGSLHDLAEQLFPATDSDIESPELDPGTLEQLRSLGYLD